MAEQRDSSGEIPLQTFLHGAGSSLAGAQQSLGSGIDPPPALTIASAELEAKVALHTDASGELSVRPLSIADIRSGGGIDVAAISTLRVSYVATAPESSAGVGDAGPMRTTSDIVAEIRSRPDIARIEALLGTMRIETEYLARTKRWAVAAFDRRGRLVREMMLPDEMP